MPRTRSKILMLSMILSSLLLCLPRDASSTWSGNVVVGNWLKYDVSLYFSAYGLIKLSYSSDVTLNITNVQPSGVNFTVADMEGNLNGFLQNTFFMRVGHDDFILPAQMIVLPTEDLVNDTISIGNVTINFNMLKESDYTKYWRGIEMREADLSSLNLIPMGNSTFGIGMISLGIVLGDIYVKYDDVTGFLYQMHMDLNFDLDLFGIPVQASGYFDISMVSASQAIASDIDARRDHSMDTLFAVQRFFSTTWIAVIVLVAGSIVSFGFLRYFQSKRSKKIAKVSIGAKKDASAGKERRMPNRRAGSATRNNTGKHIASDRAERYRKKSAL